MAAGSGVKCCLCVGDKEQSGSSGSAVSPWLAGSPASPVPLRGRPPRRDFWAGSCCLLLSGCALDMFSLELKGIFYLKKP